MNRAFIVGCPRSGTTLLRDVLGAHPEIMVFPESHFFHNLEASRPIARHLRLASRRAPRALSRFVERLEVPSEIPRPPLPFSRSYAAAFVKLLDSVSSDQGATVWIEKTPRHLDYVDLIESVVPKPLFMHMVRAGEDVVASVYEQTKTGPKPWWRVQNPSLDDCIRLWNQSVETTRGHILKPNHTLVFYEELTTAPEPELRRLCSFLGVSFDERMPLSTQFRHEPRAKFNSLFTTVEQNYILRQLRSLDQLRLHPRASTTIDELGPGE